MARKRRIFDIEMPDEDPAPHQTFPTGKDDGIGDDEVRAPRRGPMAAAITEAAQSTRARGEIEEQIRAENDALAHEYVRLKRLGLLVDLVPVDRIDATKLVRDRNRGSDLDLGELKASIQEVGLSNPIRLEARADGRYELIQGYRRLAAYRELLLDSQDETYAAIPAGISQPGDGLDDLYRRMVDENLIRKDVSFAEMARLALDFAQDPTTSVDDPDKAVARLYQSANYSKRSYIRNFIRLVEALGNDLAYIHEVPRALGVRLSQALDEDARLADRVRADLAQLDTPSAADELQILRRHAGMGDAGATPAGSHSVPIAKPGRQGQAKTSFQIDRREGRARCTAAAGRLEIKLDRDFSVIDRIRLETAVRAMLDQLD